MRKGNFHQYIWNRKDIQKVDIVGELAQRGFLREIAENIFSYLEFTDLLIVGQVSKQWADINISRRIWKEGLLRTLSVVSVLILPIIMIFLK